MTAPRVAAPSIEPGTKSKGPASYFPRIEAKYGRSMQEWIDLVVERLDEHRHMEVVSWLKSVHGLGHGHANAIVAFVRSKLDD